MGGGLLGILTTKNNSFSKLNKKLWQGLDILKSWNVEKDPNFLNCPNFVTIFVSHFDNENISFFYIPSNPSPIAVRKWLTNQFYQKNYVSVYFQQKKWQAFPGSFSSLHFFVFFCFFENIQNRNFFWKYWLVNEFGTASGRGLLGISKKHIFIFKTR